MPLGVTVDIDDQDMGMEAIVENYLDDSADFVDAGIFGDEGSDLLKIASANHFGATIQHPGGTPFGFRTQDDIDENKIRFLRKGTGALILGTTPPHDITIPARPWITTAMDNNENDYARLAEKLGRKISKGEISKPDALRRAGEQIKSDQQKSLLTGNWTPNAPSTVRRKGSDKPLIDSGRLRQSHTFSLGSRNG